MSIQTLVFVLLLGCLFVAVTWVRSLANPYKPQRTPNKNKKNITATVPAPIYITKEQEFLQRIRQIKDLVNKGKHDKALALLKRLEVIDSISNNTNVIPTQSGILKE